MTDPTTDTQRTLYPTPELGPMPELSRAERRRVARSLDKLRHFAYEDVAKTPVAFLHGIPWRDWHAFPPERRVAYIRRALVDRLISERARADSRDSRPRKNGKPVISLSVLEAKVKAQVTAEMNRRGASSKLTDEARAAQRRALAAQLFDELTASHAVIADVVAA